ncbi:MAG: nickel pincer cofactor biosynthesis protein LarB [Eubacteriaceae bacterium]|nr:nickel pincer cofactor biosynthesis protein LarB [Eubacteriaceae bacterium]
MLKELKEFAELDMERKERTGAAEAVFCQGKTPVQIAQIIKRLSDSDENIIGTRAKKEDYDETRKLVPEVKYYEEAGILAVERKSSPTKKGTIAVMTAGTADIPVAEEAAVTAALLGNRVDRIYDVGVAGIHRLLSKVDRIRNADVVIVVAGMEGALASVVGGLVETPVIAVPTSIGYGANFSGLSALLSMLNSCSAGVGIVNIDNGYGAACLADKINR